MSEPDAKPRAKTESTFVRAGLADFEQVHLISYMQLADAKAAVFLAIASGAIAYVAGHYGLGWLHSEHFVGHSLLLTATTLVLVAAAAFAIAVIVPRRSRQWRGIFFYHDIAQMASPAHYVEALLQKSDTELFREQAIYCYALAKICDRKYLLLNISLVFGILGYAGFLTQLLWR
jgi:hypothetical protein